LKVLLHEVAHVKRRDVLLNWLMILAGALHWFNPLVWLGLRRLRVNRELVCDALVLRVIEPGRERAYGATLIKLLDLFSQSRVSPILVPVLTHKHQIKRRISMITQFTPAGRAGALLTAALVGALAFVTFTRAADPKPKNVPAQAEPAAATAAASVSSDRDAERNDSQRMDAIERMKAHLSELDDRIERKQNQLDDLRKRLGIPSDLAEGQGASISPSELVKLAEREMISAQAAQARYETLAKELKSQPPSKLAHVLATAAPDTELTQLLRDLNTAEAAYSRASGEFGPEAAVVKDATRTMKTLKQQIETRVEGILTGMAAQAAASKASAEVLAKQATETVRRDAESVETFRPYFKVKRDLALLERVRDTLMEELLQKQFGQ
jgi:hypothetical protein